MNPSLSPRLTVPVDAKRDHIRGSLDAPAILMEYGDFECPHCAAAQYVLSHLEQTLGDSMALVFRNFPLTSVHPGAELAAEAAEAAGAQGMYWPMHDALFEIQDSLSMSTIVEVAHELGLNRDRLLLDLREHHFAPRVREDFLSGVRSGVNGTPTFFINGYRYNGAPTFESLLNAMQRPIESAINLKHDSQEV